MSRSRLLPSAIISTILLSGADLTPVAFAQEQAESVSPIAQDRAAILADLLGRARQALAKRDLNHAVELYEKILAIEPNHAEALYQLAIHKFQIKEYDAGFAYIKRSIELSPDKPFLRIAYAKALAEVGRNDEAIAIYQDIIAQEKNDLRSVEVAKMELAVLQFRTYAKKRDLENTERLGREIVKNYSSNKTLLQMVGNIFANLQMYDQAEEVFLVLVSMEPKHPLYNFFLAGVYERSRRPLEAEKYYQIAVDNAPHSRLRVDSIKKLNLLRGYKALFAGDKAKAQDYFEKVIAQEPNNIPVLVSLAGLQYESGKAEEGIANYEKVRELQPGNLDVRIRLASAYLDHGRIVDGVRELDFVMANGGGTPFQVAAGKILQKVGQRWKLDVLRELLQKEDDYLARLKHYPGDTDAMVGLADGYLEQGRVEDAENMLLRAIATDPAAGAAYLKLGIINQDRRDYEAAVANYQSALLYITEPEQLADLQFRLVVSEGFRALASGNIEKGEERLLTANEMRPDQREILWGLASISSQRADLEKALEWYGKILETDPDDIAVRMNMAFLYERLKEDELAIAQYRQVTVSESVTPEGRKAAEERIDYIQRQTNGVSYAVGYSLSFDDNLGGSRTQRIFEYRSDTYGALVYRLKLKKGIKFTANVTQVYSIYHKTQSDYYTSSVSPSMVFDVGDYTVDVGMSRAASSSVLRPEQSTTVTKTANSGMSWTRDALNQRLSLSYRGFGTRTNSFFDSDSFTMGYNVSHPGREKMIYSYGYKLSVTNNKYPVGSDYANAGHGFTGRVDRRIDEKLSGYIDTGINLNIYKNEDSESGFTERRRTLSLQVGTGVSYALDSWVSVYAGYRFITQYSNLPVGLVYTETQAIEGQGSSLDPVARQSSSLGSYTRNTLVTGVRMSF